MKEFKLSKLSDLVLRVKVGFVGSINQFYCNHDIGIPLIRTTDLTENGIDYSNLKFVTKEFHRKNRKSQIKKGDIIIARHGENGKANIFNEDFDAQVLNAVIIEPNENKLSSSLVKLFFETSFVKKQILGDVKGSVQGVINTSHIANLKIPISQEINYALISRVLDTLSKKIELNNRINAELEAMAKLIYEYWFVQFDFPDIEGKPYKSSGGKMVWNKELKREIPEGWKSVSLEYLAEFNPSLKIERNSEAPYLGMTSISTTGYMTDVPEKKEFSGGIKFQNGDVIVARITPCLENGKTALITMLEEGSIGFGSTEFINIRAKEKSDISFIAILSRSDFFRYFAISKMTGTSGRKRVDARELAKFQLAKPSSKLLKKYGEIVNPYFEKMTINSKQNQELASLRDWLLPMLMNGQVAVADAEEMVVEKLGMVAEERRNYIIKKR